MRRLLILAVLLAAMGLLLPLGASGRGSESLFVLGFLVLAAYAVGELASGLRLPKIVGYLLAGIAFGPSGLAVVSTGTLTELKPASDLAIALIAFLAGAELEWKELRERGLKLLGVTGVEVGFTILAVGLTLVLAREYVPFLEGLPLGTVLVFALVFAVIASIHSPAVTMALLTETQARGPTARTTLGVVLIADVLVVMLFSAALVAARGLVAASGEGQGLGAAAWEIVGALPVGAGLGVVVALYMRLVRQELLLFALLAALLGLELSRLAHVETLLVLIVAGFVSENLGVHWKTATLRHPMERSAAPVLVVFFALAGAKIETAGLGGVLPLALLLVAVRAAGIFAGTRLGGAWVGLPAEDRRHLWAGLISQAGVAIGLVTIASESYPQVGGGMRGLLLAMVAVHECVGPVLFRWGLARAGEIEPGALAVRAGH